MYNNNNNRCCVRVDNLDEHTSENEVRQMFKSFGPIRKVIVKKDNGRTFGLVYYHNIEVAEMASQGMNGQIIRGHKIHTIGPKQIHPNLNIEQKDWKDMKPLTDCYFFMLNGFCQPKLGQKCQYRHIEELRHVDKVCAKWTLRQCSNKRCPNLHPSAKSEQETMKDPSIVRRKGPPERCRSHNAFKCYGECGKENCDTHFETCEDLTKHVSTRQAPLEKCLECNAVFFDLEEKLAHQHRGSRKKGKEVSPSSIAPTTLQHGSAEPIGVFWDIENCQVPKGKSALAIVQRIRENFYPGRREVEFMCVCDTAKEKKEVLEELNKSQINIIHINATSKNAADDKLKQSLRRFAQVYKPPATIVLISGDVNFVSELSDLRHRHNMTVILVHNKHASNVLIQCANESRPFESITIELPSLNISQEEGSKEVIVSNLPRGEKQMSNKVRNQLRILCSNTGGRVCIVQLSDDPSNSIAIIKFADMENARKAVLRLNNEYVFNSQIKAKLRKQQHHKQPHQLHQKLSKPPSLYAGSKDDSQKPNLTPRNVNTNLLGGKSQSMFSLSNHPSQKDINAGFQNGQKNKQIKSSPASQVKASMSAGSLYNLSSPLHISDNRLIMTVNPHLVAPAAMYHQQVNPYIPYSVLPSLMDPVNPNRIGKINNKIPANINSKTHTKQNKKNGTKNNINNNYVPVPNPNVNNNTSVGAQPRGTTANIKPGVEMVFTNLNAAQDKKVIEKELITLVKDHCKILSIRIKPLNANNTHAFVRVPTERDAKQCISKISNKKLLGRNVKVSLVSNKEMVVSKMKDEIIKLLCETGWMPLQRFLERYKEAYKKTLFVLELERMKDIIYVDGTPGFQFVCLLYYPINSVKVKNPMDVLSSQLAEILKKHNRKVPLASIIGLYWSYTKVELTVDEGGEQLVNISNNPEVIIAGPEKKQMIFYAKKKPLEGSFYPIEDFQKDIVKLLFASSAFSIQSRNLPEIYKQFFARQLDPVDFGCNDQNELLNAVKNVEVTDNKVGKNIVLTSAFKITLLAQLLTDLLSSKDNAKLPLNSVLSGYYRFYGYRLDYRKYGFTSFTHLIASLDHNKFKVAGTGDSQVLMLCRPKKKASKKKLKKFARELVNLIKAHPETQLGLHNLTSEFSKFYGKQLKLSDFGFTKLSDLVAAIPNFVELRGDSDPKILCIPDTKPNFEKLWNEIDLLVSNAVDQFILASKLKEVYKTFFNRPFPLQASELNLLLNHSSEKTLVLGKGTHRILVSIDKNSYPPKLLREQLIRLVYTCPKFTVSIQDLQKLLMEKNSIKVSIERLIKEILESSNLFKVTNTTVQLLPDTSRKLLELEVIQILYDEPDNALVMNHFGKSYTKKFKKVITISDFGIGKLTHLIAKFTTGFVEIDYPSAGGQPTIRLKKIGRLCVECDLMVFEQGGSLMLSNFAPEYQRKYDVQLQQSFHGFSKLSDLLKCFDSVFKVFGEKNLKVVARWNNMLNPPIHEGSEENERSSSPADESSDETDSDIIIENEERGLSESSSLTSSMDLLNFNSIDEEEEEDSSQHCNDEWWMDPIPNLPEPTLQPEQTNTVSEDSVFDLISFSDFDDIRSGGIDEFLIPPLVPITYSSEQSQKGRDIASKNFNTVKEQRDEFADAFSHKKSHNHMPAQPSLSFEEKNLESSYNPQSTEPDLMRMLLGHCSPGTTPIYGIHTPSMLQPTTLNRTDQLESSTYSGSLSGQSSDTYSCLSALGDLVKSPDDPTYSANLTSISPTNRPVRPRIAANFSNKN